MQRLLKEKIEAKSQYQTSLHAQQAYLKSRPMSSPESSVSPSPIGGGAEVPHGRRNTFGDGALVPPTCCDPSCSGNGFHPCSYINTVSSSHSL